MILAWLAAAFIGGVVLGAEFALPPYLLFATAAVLALLALVPRRRPSRHFLLLGCALLCGMARIGFSPEAPSSTIAARNGQWVQAQGEIVSEPDIRATGANYVLGLQSLTLHSVSRAASGRVLLHTSAAQQLEYGDVISVAGYIHLVRANQTFSYNAWLAHQGIAATMRYPRIQVKGGASLGWLGWIVPLRQYLEAGINAWLPEPEAALMIAIALGSRTAALGDVAPILVTTGLIHLIAISGVKVGLVAGMIAGVVRPVGRRELSLAVEILAILGYVLITGATVSGWRSALMWMMVFLAAYLGRPTVTLVSLAVVAAGMVLIDPSLPWDVSFLFSTIGTFAIVAFAEPLLRLFRRTPPLLREALCVTVAAQAGTLPLTMVFFGTNAPLGPLTNMLVLPLLPILICLGFALGVAAGWSLLAAPLGSISYILLGLILKIARLASGLTLGAGLPNSPAFTIVYYALLGMLAWWLLRRAAWNPLRSARHGSVELIAGLAIASVLAVPMVLAAPATGTRVEWLGTGNAVLVQSADHSIVIDGAPDPFQLLERVGSFVPYRRRAIDLVVLPDTRSSAVNGLRALLLHYRIGAVLDAGSEYPSATYAGWRAALRRMGIPVYALRDGTEVRVGNVLISGLAPEGPCSVALNCTGIVRLQAKGHSWVLLGAASLQEQHDTAFLPNLPHTDMVVAPGTLPMDDALLSVLHPRIVAGKANLRRGVRVLSLGTEPQDLYVP